MYTQYLLFERVVVAFYIYIIIVVPGSTLSKITRFNVFIWGLSITCSKYLFVLLPIPQGIFRDLVVWLLLCFLLPKSLSSISRIFLGSPISDLFSIHHTVRISLNSLINFRLAFLFMEISFDAKICIF